MGTDYMGEKEYDRRRWKDHKLKGKKTVSLGSGCMQKDRKILLNKNNNSETYFIYANIWNYMKPVALLKRDTA